MSDSKITIPDDLVAEYSRIKRVSIEQARINLENNIKKEAEGVDLAQQYQTLIKAFRTMSPQLNGVVMREAEIAARMKQAEHDVSGLKYQLELFKERLDFEREVYKQSMALLNNIIKEDEKTIARIIALEARKLPLLTRIKNKIKCFLNF